MAQVKNSFDAETKKKILKSLYLSLISAGGAFLIAYTQSFDAKTSAFIALGTFGAFIKNAVDEYVAGK